MDARPFKEGYAFLQTSEKEWLCIDKQGDKQFIIEREGLLEGFSEGIVLAFNFSDDALVDYFDKRGTLLFSLHNGGMVSGDRVYYQDAQTGMYGYVDRTGKIVINPTWEQATDYYDGYAKVCDQRGNWYWIDSYGNIVGKAE